ncbi:MAG: hypothetical protein ACP5OV_03515 [Acidimicrobiales bacterium]
MTARIDEDFEIELRSLPGVLNVAIEHDVTAGGRVTLLVVGPHPGKTAQAALQVASLYYPDITVVVEQAAEASPVVVGDARVILVRADYDVAAGSCEVELTHRGRVGIGHSSSGPLIGGAEATLLALRDLGYDVPFRLAGATTVPALRTWPVLVTMRSTADGQERFGVALAGDDVVAAARAALDALNRYPMTFRHG